MEPNLSDDFWTIRLVEDGGGNVKKPTTKKKKKKH